MQKIADAMEPISGDLNHGHSHHHWHDEKHDNLVKKPPGSSSSSSSSSGANGSGRSTVVWRILQCKGTPPAPRYRHTATIVRTPGYTHSLVVIGGLGKGNVPLNDVHVLNLNTLTWSQLQKDPQGYGNATDYDHLGIGGSSAPLWPQPVYGHVAFACASLGDVAVQPAEEEEDEEEHETFGPGIGGKSAGVMGGEGGGGRGSSKTRKGLPAQTQSQIKMALRTAQIAARFSGNPIEVMPAYDAEWEERVVIYGGSGSSVVTPLQERAPAAAHGAHGGTNTRTGMLMGPNTGPAIAPGVVGAIIELPASSDDSDSGDNEHKEPPHIGRETHQGGKSPSSPNNTTHKKKKGHNGRNAANNLQSRAQSSAARGPRHETLSLDLRNGTWKKLQGSLAYPSQRVNHCGATVEGWAPGNPARKAICVRSADEEGADGEGQLILPPAPILGTLNGGNVNVIRSLNNQNNNNSNNKKGQGQQQHDENSPDNINLRFNSRIRALAPGITSSHYLNSIYFATPLTLRCGIVWGGSSVSMCAPDAWTLDLKWRVPGVEGFDENAKTRNAAFLQRDDKWSTHRTPGLDGTIGACMCMCV